MTSSPRASNAALTWEPMNPAAPVTSTRMASPRYARSSPRSTVTAWPAIRTRSPVRAHVQLAAPVRDLLDAQLVAETCLPVRRERAHARSRSPESSGMPTPGTEARDSRRRTRDRRTRPSRSPRRCRGVWTASRSGASFRTVPASASSDEREERSCARRRRARHRARPRRRRRRSVRASPRGSRARSRPSACERAVSTPLRVWKVAGVPCRAGPCPRARARSPASRARTGRPRSRA